MIAIDLVVARQAIYTADREVAGYELLFRSTAGDQHAAALDGDLMTSTVLFNSLSIGLERLAGGKLLFCNADREVLTGRLPMVLPPEQTVIEILETIEVDEEVLAGCRRLASLGYRLALDDFEWFEGAEQLLRLASIVKIDLMRTRADELAELAERCRAYGVELLAEKIETDEDFDRCVALGFDLFQGYALARPRNVQGRTLEASRLGPIRVATSLMSTDFDVAELEEILRTEPGMTFQLLQMAAVGNHDGLRREVHTLRDALVLVGSVRVQSWIAFLLMRKNGTVTADSLVTALSRARMCELLCRDAAPGQAMLGYTAGLLSAFELLVGQSSEQLFAELPLSASLRDAAFGGSGPVADLVRDVIDYQAGRIADERRSGLAHTDFDRASMASILWALDAVESVTRADRAASPMSA